MVNQGIAYPTRKHAPSEYLDQTAQAHTTQSYQSLCRAMKDTKRLQEDSETDQSESALDAQVTGRWGTGLIGKTVPRLNWNTVDSHYLELAYLE